LFIIIRPFYSHIYLSNTTQLQVPYAELEAIMAKPTTFIQDDNTANTSAHTANSSQSSTPSSAVSTKNEPSTSAASPPTSSERQNGDSSSSSSPRDKTTALVNENSRNVEKSIPKAQLIWNLFLLFTSSQILSFILTVLLVSPNNKHPPLIMT
jgi:hypothetical protein